MYAIYNYAIYIILIMLGGHYYYNIVLNIIIIAIILYFVIINAFYVRNTNMVYTRIFIIIHHNIYDIRAINKRKIR